MLVVRRGPSERIVINGTVTITLVGCEGGRARIGIVAPREVRIRRGELVAGTVGGGQGGEGESAPRSEAG